MKNMRITLAALAIAGIATAAIAAPTTGMTAKMKGSEFAAQARINLATARIAALKARPGTITDQELEREKGGSGLRYSFDITSHARPYEVGIDAKTGAVLENAAEGKNPD